MPSTDILRAFRTHLYRRCQSCPLQFCRAKRSGSARPTRFPPPPHQIAWSLPRPRPSCCSVAIATDHKVKICSNGHSRLCWGSIGEYPFLATSLLSDPHLPFNTHTEKSRRGSTHRFNINVPLCTSDWPFSRDI